MVFTMVVLQVVLQVLLELPSTLAAWEARIISIRTHTTITTDIAIKSLNHRQTKTNHCQCR